ncbi:hypothetical protein DL95DRAFT_420965 [Leptodontidium sp. 2 PMI_412]|nr:hypothetical protein DL95DRAFT_420965 [Leptodontidium sp. 2 PMI_412]
MLFHRCHLLLPIILLTAVVFLAFHIISFVRLFFEHADIPITQDEILEAFIKDKHTTEGAKGIQQVPGIIHQIFHNWVDPGNDTLPTDWMVVSGTCKALNDGWEYMLWTESTSRRFIKEEYPWMLLTYDGYRFPVQRVDAVRYFLLFHYGGIYPELDNGTGHPFYKLLTKSLITYNYNYIFPYITISYASGQWFETSIWEKYHASLLKTGVSEIDGSWVNWDNRFWLWVGDHLVFLSGLGFASFGGIVYRCLKSFAKGDVD